MKNYIEKKFKTREEWLKSGRRIGGSSAAAILGLSKWQSKIEVWANYFEKKVSDNKTASQEYGTKAEDMIRQLVALNLDQYNLEVIAPTKRVITMAERKDKPYLTATLDGKIRVKGDNPRKFEGKGILELKTHIVKNSEDLELWSGRLPDFYLIQLIHYLMVYNDMNFAVLVAKLLYQKPINDIWTIDKEEIRYYYISRKDFEKRITRLEKKETEFYEKYIKGSEIPSF